MALLASLAACSAPSAAPPPAASLESSPTAAPAAAQATGISSATSTAPADESSTAPITIRWRTRSSSAAEQEVYQSLNALANEQLARKNVVVEYDPATNEGYFEKLQTELAAGVAPDIFWIGSVQISDFVETGQILDIKPYADADPAFDLAAFYPQTIAELSREGALYGLPRDVSTMVVYYNADMFADAGLPTPQELVEQGDWTLERMRELARELADPSNQQYGVGFNNWWGPSWGYFVHAFGGSIFNADRTACALDSAAALEAARFVRTLYDEQLAPVDDGQALFNAGNVGMYFNGRWFTPSVRTNAQFNWDVAEMPRGAESMTWLFWGPYLVNARTENPEAAWEMLKMLTSAEAMAQAASQGANIPARTDPAAVGAFLQATPPQNNQAFLDGTPYAIAEAPIWGGSWNDYSGAVQSLWDEMILGQMSPEEFTSQVCAEANATFE
jgi:multiple sugar transport system substrate-binding protein